MSIHITPIGAEMSAAGVRLLLADCGRWPTSAYRTTQPTWATRTRPSPDVVLSTWTPRLVLRTSNKRAYRRRASAHDVRGCARSCPRSNEGDRRLSLVVA